MDRWIVRSIDLWSDGCTVRWINGLLDRWIQCPLFTSSAPSTLGPGTRVTVNLLTTLLPFILMLLCCLFEQILSCSKLLSRTQSKSLFFWELKFNTSSFAEMQSIADLESKLSDIKIPWHEIAPQNIQDWLDIFAKSHGTTCDLLLTRMLLCTGALIGDTTVKLFDSWRENGNLFFIGLAPSGAGKTPACNVACVKPLISHLELRVQ